MTRVPPSDADAERAILAAAMTTTAARTRVLVDLAITPEDMALEAHQAIMAAIVATDRRGIGSEPGLVVAQLQADGTLDLAGGRGAVWALTAADPSPSSLAGYAVTVRDTARRRRLIHACSMAITGAHDPTVDMGDLIADHDQQLAGTAGQEAAKPSRTMAQIIEGALPQWERPENHRGLSTGISALDHKLGGLRPGNLCVIAARPGMGKTALAVDFAASAARQGTRAFVISLEMTDEEIAARWTAREALVPGRWLTAGDGRGGLGDADQENWAAVMHVADGPAAHLLEVASRRGIRASDAVRLAKRAHARNPVGLVVVDYLQLLRPDDTRSPRHVAVGDMVNRLKTLAFDLHCPVVVLSQLNREADSRPDKRPQLSDLRESGDIEQTADQVLLLFREGYYNADGIDDGSAEITIAKNRHGEFPVRVDVQFDREYPRFRDRVKHYTDGPPLPVHGR